MSGWFRPGVRVLGRDDTIYKNRTGTISGEGYIQVKPTIISGESVRYIAQRVHTCAVTWDGSEKEELVDEDQLDVM